MAPKPLTVGLIGFGAIGSILARALPQTGHRLVGILARQGSAASVQEKAGDATVVVTSIHDLLALAPDVVVEAAGHAALRAHGAAILSRGTNLVVASIGALADPALETALRDAAATGGGRLVIPSGALGALDALGAARLAGLDEVSYVSRKAPSAWVGTMAETLIELASVSQAQVFFEGTARQAALDFPQNANVVAAVALAGIGFDRTSVRLTVDPAATGNQHVLQARGAFGEISATFLARTLPDNPKTSFLAPYSLLRAIDNLAAPMIV